MGIKVFNDLKINNIVDLKIFALVTENGSFTKSAEQSGLSRSAVGKIIAKLEENLNHRLFHRTTRVVKLTHEGEIFYEHVQRILREIEDAEQVLNHDQLPKGKFKITVPSAFGRLHVMPIVWQFLQKYPEVDLEVLFTDDYSDLIREGIDLAIRIGNNADSSLIQKVLAYHQLIICASPAYLEKHGKPMTIDDLKDHQCLLYLHQTQAVIWKYQENQQEKEIALKGHINLQDTESLKNAALEGFGIVQLSSFLVQPLITKTLLTQVLTEFSPKKEPICAIYPSKKHLSPKVRLFIELLKENWQGQSDWNT